MFSNRLAVVLLGVGCITAAGLGGYFAASQNTVPTPAAAQAQPVDGVPLTPATAERPVQETEALVGDTRPKAAPVAAEREPAPVALRSARRPEPPPSRRAAAPLPPRPQARSARNEPAPLSSSWPSSAASQPPSSSAPPVSDPSAFPRSDERTSQEPARAPERVFEELVVSADSVIGLQTENRLSSETARVEDKVDAKVTRD